MKTYYYADDIEDVQGPLLLTDLDALFKVGAITSATQICEEGTETWIPFYQVNRTTAPRKKIINNIDKIVEELQPKLEPKIEPSDSQPQPKPISFSVGRVFRLSLLLGGFCIIGYYFFFFGTSVEGMNNFGLLDDKQNGIIIGGILAIVGAIIGQNKQN